MAWINAYFDGNLQAGADMFERALALIPNDTSLLGDTASFMGALRRIDESLALNELVLARDPVHPVARANYASMLTAAGRYKESIEQFREALRLSSDYGGGRVMLGLALLLAGKTEDALAQMRLESTEAYRLTGLAMAELAAENKAASDQALAPLIDQFVLEWPFNIAEVFADQGENDLAFKWLQKAIDAGAPDLAEIHINVLFKPVQSDPRWQEMLIALGKSPEQLNAIKFSVPARL